jgi:hypothetical protein
VFEERTNPSTPNVEESWVVWTVTIFFSPTDTATLVVDLIACRGRTSIMLSEGDQGQPGSWVWIAADNVDELYAELHARGARLRHPPTNYPWGSRECQVADPDGHVLRLGMESKPGEPPGEWLDGEGKRWMPQSDGAWRAVE